MRKNFQYIAIMAAFAMVIALPLAVWAGGGPTLDGGGLTGTDSSTTLKPQNACDCQGYTVLVPASIYNGPYGQQLRQYFSRKKCTAIQGTCGANTIPQGPHDGVVCTERSSHKPALEVAGVVGLGGVGFQSVIYKGACVKSGPGCVAANANCADDGGGFGITAH